MPIGRLLVERGFASLAAVEEAASSALTSDSRLCSKLLDAGVCDEGDLAGVLAERHGVPGVDLSRTAVDLTALELVPQAVAEADLVLPLSTVGSRVHLAVASPEQAARVVSEIRFVTGREVSIYVVVLSALRDAIAACYQASAHGAAVWRGRAAPHDAAPTIAVRLPPPLSDEALPELSDPDFVAEDECSSEHAQGAESAAERHERGAARRVLVVDDEPAIRLLIQRALEHHGFAVDCAVDGAEALQKARTGGPHLVLLDAMLPKLHGFEVARRLRSDPATRDLPIIMITAVYRGWRFAQDARESFGAQDYIEKPFRVDDLLRRVEAVLHAPRPQPEATTAPLLEAGRAALAEGRLDDAVASFEQAVQTDPFSADAFHGLGQSLRALGDGFRAMSALERAVELRPRAFSGLRALAELYLEKGFRAKAAEVLERAVHAAANPAAREKLRRKLLPLL